MFTTVIAIGCAVFVLGLFAGMCVGLAEDPPGIQEPKGAQICYGIAILGALVAFMAAICDMAIRFFSL